MGKHGPCRHCGVTSTPLWRNGPPDKPVLCNACGSRWRTKGSLTNYIPLHAREPINTEELKVSRVKSISFKPKEKKLNKVKKSYGAAENEREMPYSDQNFRKILEVDTSNRSSSGSATSYSESCAQFGTTEASDLTGSAQSNVRESQVPSKNKTSVIRTYTKPSPVEKLTQDLYTIMQEQSSCLSSSSEDLLYESISPIGSFELSNGSILLRYPNRKVVEEESEASSLPTDKKSCMVNEAYSGSASFPVHRKNEGTSFSTVGIEKLKKCTAHGEQVRMKRDKSYMDKLHLLQDRESPLGFINLKDVVNFEVFMRRMTDEEQQQLMKYLPSTDTVKYSESLRTMFNSAQFEEALSYFQHSLQGVFDPSFSGMDGQEYRTLKRLLLRNSSTSTWVQHHKTLKDVKSKLNTIGREVAINFNHLGHSKFTSLNGPPETQDLHVPEQKSTMRSLKRVAESSISGTNPQSILIYDAEEFVDNDGTCFSPRTIFASPPDRTSMFSSLRFSDDSATDDLILDVPGNNLSFPETELLYHPCNQKFVGRNNSYAESGVFGDGEESRSGFPVPTFNGQKARHF